MQVNPGTLDKYHGAANDAAPQIFFHRPFTPGSSAGHIQLALEDT